jgi:archaellum component FlaC
MSEDQLRKIKETLAEVDREAIEVDKAVASLKRAAAESTTEVKRLKERSERVQRRLSSAAS